MSTDVRTPQTVTHLPNRTVDTAPDIDALVDAHVAALTNYSRRRYQAVAAFAVACPRPTCREGAGSPCRTRTRAISNVFHAERKAIVEARTLDDQIRGYARVVVERELRRKEAQTYREQIEADPELAAKQAESRRRTGAIWDNIGREVETAGRRCRHVYLHESGCDCRNTGLAKVIPFPQEQGMRPVTYLDDVRGAGIRTSRPMTDGAA